jgi:hypothetical protein
MHDFVNTVTDVQAIVMLYADPKDFTPETMVMYDSIARVYTSQESRGAPIKYGLCKLDEQNNDTIALCICEHVKVFPTLRLYMLQGYICETITHLESDVLIWEKIATCLGKVGDVFIDQQLQEKTWIKEQQNLKAAKKSNPKAKLVTLVKPATVTPANSLAFSVQVGMRTRDIGHTFLPSHSTWILRELLDPTDLTLVDRGVGGIPAEYAKLAQFSDVLGAGQVLGAGAFGVVYAGTYAGIPVAVKVAYSAFHNRTDFLAFSGELKAAHTLGVHPNIVRVLGILLLRSAQGGICWGIVQERATSDLFDLLNTKSKPDYMRRYKWLIQLARGLTFMHNRDFIHFDLRPENILIDKRDDLLIADLGASRVHAPSMGSRLRRKMTPDPSCPPEGFTPRDQPLTDRFDVFSFGILLCDLFYNRSGNWDSVSSIENEYIQNNATTTTKFKGIDTDVETRMKYEKRAKVIPPTKLLKTIALQCLKSNAVERPSMAYILEQITKDAQQHYPDALAMA